MNPRVKLVKPIKDYKLHLTFTNGEEGIFDCKALLEIGVFKELKDVNYFRMVRPDTGSISWPHEQDLCPDTLYLESEKLTSKNLI
jgi:hypothetical protein